jgi:hypothetical protein
MELLASLDLSATTSFFTAFFALPTFYWRGFLASKLTPMDLVAFALLTFIVAGAFQARVYMSNQNIVLTGPPCFFCRCSHQSPLGNVSVDRCCGCLLGQRVQGAAQQGTRYSMKKSDDPFQQKSVSISL